MMKLVYAICLFQCFQLNAKTPTPKAKNKVGRPLKFKTVEDLQKAIDGYFKTAIVGEYTITGLALALDTYRSVLVDYEGRDEYSNAVKKAKTRIENDYERSLRRQGRSGDIFGLKNFGWKDKSEIDQKTETTFTLASALQKANEK